MPFYLGCLTEMRSLLIVAIFGLIYLQEAVTEDSISEKCSGSSNAKFTCQETGLFDDPADKTCMKYYECSNYFFFFTENTKTCLNDTFFDPSIARCSSNYKCACTKNTTTTTTTTTLAFTTADPRCDTKKRKFQCTKEGTFPDMNDVTCKKYHSCSSIFTFLELYVQADLVCPGDSYFDVKSKQCSLSYKCPCLINGKQAAVIETTIPAKVATTTTPVTTTKVVSNSIEAVTTYSCINENTPDFVCKLKGRFPNLKDPSCSGYYLCSLLQNGSIIKTSYSCPRDSFFDPSLNICSKKYKCSCDDISTTPTSISTKSTSTHTSTSPQKTSISTIITPTFPTNNPSSLITEESTTLTRKTTSTTNQDTSISSTTQSECIISDDIEFTCTEKGRFANLSDPSCTIYYLCTLLRNGTFLQTPYTCPKGSFFDPSINICNEVYKCPCDIYTIPTSTTVETSTLSSTTSSSTEQDTSSIASTTPSQCITSDDTEFTCTEKGRFANLSDPSCTNYYLCSLLRNGTFLQTPYTCPEGSFFDPSINICNEVYKCPCDISTIPTSTTVETTTLSSTTSSSTEQDTSSIASTTPSQCIISDDTEFICTEKGRFANLSDPSCTIYYLCTLLRNGTFLQTPYTCPKGSFFDPSINICNEVYKCPCDISTIPTSTTVETTTLSSTTSSSTEQDTSSIASTTPSQCIISDDTEFICTEKGRFANLSDPSCTNYYLCSLLRNGTFLQTPYTCPKGSFFDPSINICNEVYKCPCDISTIPTSTTVETTTLSSTTSSSTEQDTSSIASTTPSQCIISDDTEFTCTEKGRFVNLSDPSCTNYYLCSLLRNGTFLQTPYTCPKGSFFDPSINICNEVYKCPCDISTIPTSTTVETTTLSSTTSSSSEQDTSSTASTTPSQCIISDDTEFTCTEKGRFANLSDPSCTNYYLCSLLRNGTFLQTPYTCPKGSFFDPSINICNEVYKCPCDISTIPTSTTVETTTLSSTTSSSTEQDTSSIASTTPSQCIISDDTEFICTEKGRFANLSDPSCTNYYLCSLLRNGTFLQTPYTCPKGSFFDPSINICNEVYKCPCDISTIPTSTTVETTTLSSTTSSSTEQDTTSSIASTTPSQCIISDDTEFTCTEKGRFVNLSDPSCTNYYLCSLLRNGTFLQTPYTCPKGSFFDPSINICNEVYKCPCDISTIPTSTTVETTTLSSTTSSSTEQDTSSIASTTPSQCIISDDTEFTCTEKGRFANLKDLSCNSYYLCSLLRNGTLIKTPYNCPIGSFFDPLKHVCTKHYECPCDDVTTLPHTSTTENRESTIAPITSPITSTSKKDTGTSTVRTTTLSSTEYTSTQPPSTEDTTTRQTSSTTLKSTTTTFGTSTNIRTTTSMCIISDKNDFNCTARGRFANLNDLSCNSYYLCSLLRNGTLIKIPYNCPTGSFFDPLKHVCTKHYKCPCDDVTILPHTSTTENSESTIAPTTLPITSTSEKDTSTSTMRTTTLSSTEYTSTQPPSTEDTTTRQASSTTLKSTTTTFGTSTNIRTTTSKCIISDKNDFNCTARGRFANLNDLSCNSYYLCSLLRNGTIIKTPYNCPTGSFFDPLKHVCTKHYECPCDDVTTLPHTSTTENRESTIAPITSPITSTSKKDTGTSTVRTTTLSSTEYTSTQPPSTEDTTTRQTSSTTLKSTTTSFGTSTNIRTTTSKCIISDKNDFNCTARGRFANLNDLSCNSYYLCSLLRNGTIIKTPYNCPAGSFFDPLKHVCTKHYECPCDDVTTLPHTSTTENRESTIAPTTSLITSTSEKDTGTSTVRTTTLSSTEYTSTQPPSTEDTTTRQASSTTLKSTTTSFGTSTNIRTTTSKCIISDKNDFSCTARGRFANLNDLSCNSYYLCSLLRNGTLIKTPYNCPTGSFFDPLKHVCTKHYECPCDDVTFSTLPHTSASTTESNESTTGPSTSQITSTPEMDTSSSTAATSSTTLPTSSTTESVISTSQIPTTTERDITTSKSPCTISADYKFNCKMRGRFADLNDPSCTNYYLCSLLRNGTFLKTPYSCPKGSFFDASKGLCNQKYECPCVRTTSIATTTLETTSTPATSTTIGDQTTSVVITTPSQCTTSTEIFNCQEKGRFANSNDLSCSSYYLCSLLSNGTLLKTQYNCPSDSWFDPASNKCSKTYDCPCENFTPAQKKMKNPETTTVSNGLSNCLVLRKSKFNCSLRGRYAHVADVSCSKYYLCSQLRGGRIVQTEYNCPEGSTFDPQKRMCSKHYSCPCKTFVV